MIDERKLRHRKIEKHIKYSGNRSNVVSERKKEYEYYICDYCGGEIEIKENRTEQTGGIAHYRGFKLVLHNKCLNPMLKEL